MLRVSDHEVTLTDYVTLRRRAAGLAHECFPSQLVMPFPFKVTLYLTPTRLKKKRYRVVLEDAYGQRTILARGIEDQKTAVLIAYLLNLTVDYL